MARFYGLDNSNDQLLVRELKPITQQQDRHSALHTRIAARSTEAAGLKRLAIPQGYLIYSPRGEVYQAKDCALASSGSDKGQPRLLAITLGRIRDVQKEDAGTGSRRLPKKALTLLLVGLWRQTQIRT